MLVDAARLSGPRMCSHRVQCDVSVVCWLDACTAAWLGGLPFVARVALSACVGGLAFVLCALGGSLL